MCPTLLVSAPASHQGKTTVTAALARYHRNQGRKVRIFKTGPDFLDPMILEQASGNPVYQLDLWMGGEAHCRELLYAAADEADLILIEGVMGLFDGNPSSADLAVLFNIPVLMVIDASAMAQTFGALVHGLSTYRPALSLIGVFANQVANECHFQLLNESLPTEIKSYGWLPRDNDINLPERHLGLVQAEEIADLDDRIAWAANAIRDSCHSILQQPTVFPVTEINPVTEIHPVAEKLSVQPLLAGITIAIARDAAFAFLYRANTDLLKELGAELIFFSVLENQKLPQADALYFPGGYPELHLDRLEENHSLKHAIHDHHQSGRPIVAECGGMLYLSESLTDRQGKTAQMTGLLPGKAMMQSRLANLGLQSALLPEGPIRGHTFHHSTMAGTIQPLTLATACRQHGRGEAVYRVNKLTASYLHWYFPSNPAAAAQLFL